MNKKGPRKSKAYNHFDYGSGKAKQLYARFSYFSYMAAIESRSGGRTLSDCHKLLGLKTMPCHLRNLSVGAEIRC
ncbi:hypothetical protein E2C01_037382 [Portunus trituberculatus]|uniref:Uncharacterized protein n=1 Tax=Portunus trituberculatus TaxID=210409 RepID=A0A5B7F800_PORTR|nr:hypothetical protein [Portunus trituberculatus]